jgi:pimeloyl-ACP methyl ester carboxylesterase
VDFEEIVVETDRLDFPALAAGDGPVVVCWHGFPDHPLTFTPLAERLVAAGWRVVLPFLRGFHPATVDVLITVEGVAEAVLETDRQLIDYLWSTWSPGLTVDAAHRTRVHEIYGDPKYIENALKIYRANFDPTRMDPAMVEHTTRTETTATKPLLVLGGADDGCIDARHFAGAYEGLASGSKVEVLARAGHFLHLEQPDAVAKLVLDWLQE